MPKSVTKALSQVWATKGIPKNIETICYTYGDTCYSPYPLSKDLIVHESTHTEQQKRSGMTPDIWWNLYGSDPKFRYEQEMEAYRAQYKYLVATIGKRKAFNGAKIFASQMSAPMYGGMATFNQALQDLLRN